jgi:DNA repair exonuclease SbcCD nuclease subunit
MAHLLHTSDTHLGFRQYHLDDRRQDFADAFSEVITSAIEHDVDAVVHAGDLFHTSRPGITPLQTVLTELQRLQSADIPFLLIVGNHERTHDRNWVDLLAEVELATRLDATGTRINDTTIYGLDYIPPAQRDRLDYNFEPAETESAVLVGHGLFKPFGHGDWSAQRIIAQSPVDFDLMLVGDDHGADYKLVTKNGSNTETSQKTTESGTDLDSEQATETVPARERIPLSYAGSTERTKADQRDPRTYSLVTVPPEGGVDPQEHIDRQVIESAREFVYVDVPLHRGDGIETVEQTIREKVDRLDEAVLKVTLMAAEEGPPVPDSTEGTGDAASDDTSEPAVHEQVPVGPLENLGTELGALVTRVSDRRDLLEDEREYQAVEFADVDAAVEERRRDIVVTEAADQFLEMAMNTDQVTDSSMADTAQETVKALLERESPESFHIDKDATPDGAIEENTAESTSGSTSPAAGRSDDVDNEELLEDALEELND